MKIAVHLIMYAHAHRHTCTLCAHVLTRELRDRSDAVDGREA